MQLIPKCNYILSITCDGSPIIMTNPALVLVIRKLCGQNVRTRLSRGETRIHPDAVFPEHGTLTSYVKYHRKCRVTHASLLFTIHYPSHVGFPTADVVRMHDKCQPRALSDVIRHAARVCHASLAKIFARGRATCNIYFNPVAAES